MRPGLTATATPTSSSHPTAWSSPLAVCTDHRRNPISIHLTRIQRSNPATGLTERPWRQRDRTFVLGDPAHGSQRHHKENAVFVPSYLEALELVRKGFAIRMSDGRSAPSLVAPGSLELIDEPVDRLDDLWTYTMPEPPFSLETVMVEMKEHLRSQAADLGLIANADAASAFIGFAFDPFDDGESDEALERIDLSRFNMTRVVTAAYHSAFRPTAESELLSEDDVDELEQIMAGSLARFGRRHRSPLDQEGSALQRTVLSAYYRWQIIDGCFLEGVASKGDRGMIDQSVTEALAALTGMPTSAVRNTLSRDGLSLVRSKLDPTALTQWVTTRRNFAPLREDETYEGRWAWRIANELHRQPGPEGFARARARIGDPSPDLDEAEAAIMKRRATDEMPTAAELRRYATALHVSPDSLFAALQAFWGRR